MKLETITREQCQQVRVWRNEEPQFLRTPYLITEQMQDEFFDNVINNRDSKHRYFAIVNPCVEGKRKVGLNNGVNIYEDYTYAEFIGMCGLTNIEWENGYAEISLIINPEYRGKGNGLKAVDLLLNEAFKNMRLLSVHGEVYNCGNVKFWRKAMELHPHYQTELPGRKYYNGEFYGSLWFSFLEGEA